MVSVSVILGEDELLMIKLPVIVPPARGSFAAMEFVTVVEKFASSPSAAANSFRVFNVLGAESTIKATRASARASV